jgi:hypothetical protein
MVANLEQVGGDAGPHADMTPETWERIVRMGREHFQAEINACVERWVHTGAASDLERARDYVARASQWQTEKVEGCEKTKHLVGEMR